MKHHHDRLKPTIISITFKVESVVKQTVGLWQRPGTLPASEALTELFQTTDEPYGPAQAIRESRKHFVLKRRLDSRIVECKQL